MNKRGRSIDGPAALVGALAAGRGAKRRRRRPRSPLRAAGSSALRSVRTAAGKLSDQATLSPKRRRALSRNARKRLDRFSAVANSVGALLGVAAAGAEVVSAIRDRKDHDHGEHTNGAEARDTGTEARTDQRTEQDDDVRDLEDEGTALGDEGTEREEREEDEKQEVFDDARR